jgi:hypothetical protein
MDGVLRGIVETFETGIGPFAEPGIVELVADLPQTMVREDVQILIQGHRRRGVRTTAVLVAVLGDDLVIAAPGGARQAWPVASSSAAASPGRLAGVTLTIVVPDETLTVSRAITVDECERLVHVLAHDPHASEPLPVSRNPPVSRLGASATLYVDRIAFRDGETRMLEAGISARPLDLPTPARSMESLTRLVRGPRPKPRHVLVDGPGWSQVVSAPEEAPDQTDEFVAAVNYWARNS